VYLCTERARGSLAQYRLLPLFIDYHFFGKTQETREIFSRLPQVKRRQRLGGISYHKAQTKKLGHKPCIHPSCGF
jgi:hypothetical protein